MYISKYQIRLLGILIPNYFSGFGACETNYDYAVYGKGSTEQKAFMDMMEKLHKGMQEELYCNDVLSSLQEEYSKLDNHDIQLTYRKGCIQALKDYAWFGTSDALLRNFSNAQICDMIEIQDNDKQMEFIESLVNDYLNDSESQIPHYYVGILFSLSRKDNDNELKIVLNNVPFEFLINEICDGYNVSDKYTHLLLFHCTSGSYCILTDNNIHNAFMSFVFHHSITESSLYHCGIGKNDNLSMEWIKNLNLIVDENEDDYIDIPYPPINKVWMLPISQEFYESILEPFMEEFICNDGNWYWNYYIDYLETSSNESETARIYKSIREN